jgi:hypothetical protein
MTGTAGNLHKGPGPRLEPRPCLPTGLITRAYFVAHTVTLAKP